METLLPFEKTKRELLVRKTAKTCDKFGKKPFERSIEELINYGIVNVNKPRGPTSHQVSAYTRNILGLKKSGHSGTLDPNVTGVLPVALGRATRVVEALLNAGKEYVCIMHIHSKVDEKKIREVMQNFVGKIKQLPPVKSAVKRQERFRRVYYIEILEIDGQDVLFRVGCEAGTYIRKLCHDMGLAMNTGAHMAELIRTKAGPFNDSTMFSLQDLTDAYAYWKEDNNDEEIRKIVQPMENGVSHLPKIWVFDSTVNSLCYGMNLKVPGISLVESGIELDQMVAVMSLKNELIAVGRAKMMSDDMIKSEKGIAVEINKVFMEPNTYPRIEKFDNKVAKAD
jgi:H/ACA ribonucleoprotein complex subunit 4